jgi:hypothetical protein
MFALVSASDGTPIVISGPCWPFCLFVTVPLIIGISCLVIFFLILGETFALVRIDLFCVTTLRSVKSHRFQCSAKLDIGYLYPLGFGCPCFPFLCVVS